MDVRQKIREFISTYQTTAWILLIMAGGLLLQGILFLIVTALGHKEVYPQIIRLLSLPPDDSFFRQPWSFLTYIFVNADFSLIRLLVDAWILWIFGRLHQQMLSDIKTRRFIILAIPFIGLMTVLICIISGIGGMGQPAASFSYLYYVSGMTPLVVAVVISLVTLVPDYPVQVLLFGKVKLIWVGIFLLLVELVMANFITPLGIAISVGALTGFLNIYMLRKGVDVVQKVWEFYSVKDPRPKMKVKFRNTAPTVQKTAAKGAGKASPAKDATSGAVSQEVIDKILDKISEEGYEKLSREEKELLFRASVGEDDWKKDE
jgi:hypothetical protein